MKKLIVLLILISTFMGCATGRNITSPNYIPEWENRVINAPPPSETSGGRWAAKTANTVGSGVGKALLVPFAVVGNIAMHIYYIPTWPFRWLFRGDKRLIVWNPIFRVGEKVGSEHYSKEWNAGLV